MCPIEIEVLGTTQADIEAARDACGPYGVLKFPGGVFEVDGLTAGDAGSLGQVWMLRPDTVLKRSPTTTKAVVSVPANGSLELVGGIYDGNRANNPHVPTGAIEANDGAHLKMSGDFLVRDAPYVGIWGRDGLWDIRDGRVVNTGYWGIYWAAITLIGGQRRKAPKIRNVQIDRSMVPIASGMGGGININGGPTNVIKECRDAEVNDCTISLPLCSTIALRNAAYDAVAVEANYCYMPILTRNRVVGGRIGISTQTCPWAIQSLNQGSTLGDYLIEMVNCEFGSAVGNMGTGAGASIANFGVVVSGTLSKGLNIVGNNTKMLFGASVYVYPNANNSSYPHVITGNH
ncbi:hypothetical protein WDZ92_01040 [Nostoc sp. NIES-2111]